jgi:DNA repair protein RadB
MSGSEKNDKMADSQDLEVRDDQLLEKLSSGNKDLDIFLNSGYDKDIITTFYGPSGSGKTTLCLLALISTVRSKKKVIYIDTEASFSVERLKQIAPLDYEDIMKNVLFLKPVNFKEQQKSFDKLRALVNDSIGLIVIDTISMLYRLEAGQTKDIYEVNKQLGMQLSFLSEISRRRKIPVLVSNQVYSSFEEKDKVNMVGGDILKYGSKTLLELQSFSNGLRALFVRKARSLPEGLTFAFKLVEHGIEKVEK